MQEEYHISRPTMYRAKEEMRLNNITVGFDKKNTYWIAPELDKEAFKADRMSRMNHDNPYY